MAKKQRENIADYVAVTPSRGDHPVVLRDSTLCFGNLEHGVEYTLALRSGLTDIHGRTVVPGERRVLVSDRPARARFSTGRYVLPMAGSASIPLNTVNMEEVPLSLLRITEGNLVDEAMHGRVGRNLGGYDLREITRTLGERLWQGTVQVSGERNRDVVTAIPIDDLLPPDRKPGVYLLAASPTKESQLRSYHSRAVQ